MFAKLYRQYENMASEDRLELMRRDCAIFLPALSELNGGGEREFLIFIFSAFGEGRVLSPDEYSLICEAAPSLPGYSEACGFVGGASGDADDAIEILSLLGDEEKSSLISFCLCFCAARGKRLGREKRYLKSLVK